jgi:hypothetical protein
LLGILLLIGGFFLPWIIRITYEKQAGCSTGPDCPPPFTQVFSYGDGWPQYFFSGRLLTGEAILAFLWGPAPFLTLIIVQG